MGLIRKGIVGLVVFASAGMVSAFVQKTTSEAAARRWELKNPHRQIPDSIINRQTQAIRYHLAEDAFSEANREAELNAIRASFGQWMSIPDSRIAFEEGPLVSTDVGVNTRDGTNIVRWAKSSTLVNGGRSDIRGRNGLAFVSFYRDGEITEVDIVFNGVDSDWYADPRNPENDGAPIETVALHEIGHLLGLAHTVIPSAMMFPRGCSGMEIRNGLTPDETAFAQSQYGVDGLNATLGVVEGRVTVAGDGVLGAGVLLEDSDGGIVASTISLDAIDSHPLGQYRFPAVSPGNYQVRIFPLSPAGLSTAQVKAQELDSSRFADAEVNFTPSEGVPVTVSAGQTVTHDFQITLGEPAFRIDRFREPTGDPKQIRSSSSPILLSPGSPTVSLGVFGEGLPLEDVDFLITGDGLDLGPVETTDKFSDGLPHIFREVTVTENATPGPRSFILQHGTDRAIAAGYFLVQASNRDDNYDGFSDEFQREHFAVFTDPSAAPDADPDRDGISNRDESLQGTNPNISDRETPLVAPFPIDRVAVTAQGATITLSSSVEGALYQLYTRDHIEGDEWEPVGEELFGTGAELELFDSASREIRFYEVRVVE